MAVDAAAAGAGATPAAAHAATASAVALLTQARALLAQVVDPEIPVVTIADLGILRGVDFDADGALQVTITPTYSGCPAVDQIEADIRTALAPLSAGGLPVQVQRQLAPAWTTDWITPQGRARMREFGIAPPVAAASESEFVEKTNIVTLISGAVRDSAYSLRRRSEADVPPCPRCASRNVTEISHFASTACKSLWRCLDCLEPFDHFKAH